MKKRILLPLIILLSIFMVGAVSASSNDSVASSSKLTKSISVASDTGDVDISNVKNSEVKDTNTILKKDNSKKRIVISNNHAKSETTCSSESETYKKYYDEPVHDAYIQSKTVYYKTDNNINFGWKGNLEGYFKIYKGNKQIYSYHIEGYNKKYIHNPNGLKVGKYTTKIISNGKTIAKGKLIVKYETNNVKKGKTYRYGKYKGKFTKKQLNSLINAKNNGKNKIITVPTGKKIKYPYYTYKPKTIYQTKKLCRGTYLYGFIIEYYNKKGWTIVKSWYGKKRYQSPYGGYYWDIYGKLKKITYVKIKKYKTYNVKMSLSNKHEDGTLTGKNKAILTLWTNKGKINQKEIKI